VKILFMMTEPRVMKYYHEDASVFMLKTVTASTSPIQLGKIPQGDAARELATESPER